MRPHLAWVRTPAYDVASVPMAQRNRWFEPFREGIATPDGFKRPDRIRDAVRVRQAVAVVRADDYVIHVSPCVADRSAAYLVVIDGRGFAEPPVHLTERQLELLGHLRRGLSNAEIAAAMGNAPSTVKTMLERLYQRAGVANRVELLAWATQRST